MLSAIRRREEKYKFWEELIDYFPDGLLLALASTVTFNSESHRTHGHILLSDGSARLYTLPSATRYDDMDHT
jgi:hypothetical protein